MDTYTGRTPQTFGVWLSQAKELPETRRQVGTVSSLAPSEGESSYGHLDLRLPDSRTVKSIHFCCLSPLVLQYFVTATRADYYTAYLTSVFLFIAEQHSAVWIQETAFNHSPIGEHLDCFQSRAIMDKAATNIHGQVLSKQNFVVFWDKYPRGQLLG